MSPLMLTFNQLATMLCKLNCLKNPFYYLFLVEFKLSSIWFRHWSTTTRRETKPENVKFMYNGSCPFISHDYYFPQRKT